MSSISVIFFGSFQHYSTLVLESLHADPRFSISAVITTPPMPAGRKGELRPTHTHQWAQAQNLPVYTPDSLNQANLNKLQRLLPSKPHYFLVAGYGKILPQSWLDFPQGKSLNLHFSLLPAYRGANPAEYAILCNESLSGITLMEMDAGLDTGAIIAKRDTAIKPDDNRITLYQKLYQLGADTLPDMFAKYHTWSVTPTANCQTSLAPQPQPINSPTPYARLLKRNDGFISWDTLSKAIHGETLSAPDFDTDLFKEIISFIETKRSREFNQSDYLHLIERASRALHDYPGLWSSAPTAKGDKRLKVHSCKIRDDQLILDSVQLEGQSPSLFNQIKNQLLL